MLAIEKRNQVTFAENSKAEQTLKSLHIESGMIALIKSELESSSMYIVLDSRNRVYYFSKYILWSDDIRYKVGTPRGNRGYRRVFPR